MKRLYRMGAWMLVVFLLLTACAGGSPASEEEKATRENMTEKTTSEAAEEKEEPYRLPEDLDLSMFRIVSLKGPTGFGIAPLTYESFLKTLSSKEPVQALGSYRVLALPEEAVSAMTKKEADFAFVPANMASILYNKTQGQVLVAATNNLGVLYMVDNDGSIKSWEDLKGKTIYTTGKGATPDIVLNRLLKEKGIDATVEFKSEASEIAGLLAKEEHVVGLLPEPFVTVAKTKNEKVNVALDLNKAWEEVTGNPIVTGVLIVQKEFAQAHPEETGKFLDVFEACVDWVNENPKEGAKAIGALDIVPEAVAEKAIPGCHLKVYRGEELKEVLGKYLSTLAEENPKQVGGKLPAEDFYFK